MKKKNLKFFLMSWTLILLKKDHLLFETIDSIPAPGGAVLQRPLAGENANWK